MQRWKKWPAAIVAIALVGFGVGRLTATTVVVDPFQGVSVGLSDPPPRWVAVTPSDSTDLTIACRCIWVGGDGDIKVIDQAGGSALTLYGAKAGTQISGRFSRIYSTGTTATNLAIGY